MLIGASSVSRASSCSRDVERVFLRVRGGELAAGRAGAGDEPGPQRIGAPVEAERLDRAPWPLRPCRRRRRRSAGSATPSGADRRRRSRARSPRRRASGRRSFGRPAAPRRSSSSRPAPGDGRRYAQRDRPAGAAAIAVAATRVSGRPSLASTAARNFSMPQPSSTYLSRALVRSVRSPLSMKTRTIASATAVHSSGSTNDADVARQIAVAGDPADARRETTRPARRPRPRRRAPPGNRCRWSPPAWRYGRRRRRRR